MSRTANTKDDTADVELEDIVELPNTDTDDSRPIAETRDPTLEVQDEELVTDSGESFESFTDEGAPRKESPIEPPADRISSPPPLTRHAASPSGPPRGTRARTITRSERRHAG